MNADHGAEFGAPRVEIAEAAQETPKRDVWLAVRRGLRCRCPNCGEPTLFTKYLKVADHCAACGEELHHHRADDMPPWLTLLVVCHILGLLILTTEQTWDTPQWVHFTIWPAVGVIASLALLPRMKGAVVGMQWAMRMHGFQQVRS